MYEVRMASAGVNSCPISASGTKPSRRLTCRVSASLGACGMENRCSLCRIVGGSADGCLQQGRGSCCPLSRPHGPEKNLTTTIDPFNDYYVFLPTILTAASTQILETNGTNRGVERREKGKKEKGGRGEEGMKD